jgi:membrane protease YdiL (CAAX protease family)
MLAKIAGIFFVLLLVAGVPTLSFLTARQRHLRFVPRRALYVSAILSQWLLAALGVVVVLVIFGDFAAVSFRPVASLTFLRWTLALCLAALAFQGILLVCEHSGWWPAESETVRLLLPETRQEKLWCVLLVAPTAALCEEFVYRGYLLTQLSAWLPSRGWAWAASALAFGLAHTYQGLSGVLRAGVLGAFFAYPVLCWGSLYPSMAAHFIYDALALVWLGPHFLKFESRVDAGQ